MTCAAPSGARRRVCTVGLTGGLASGKSAAAIALAACGAAVCDADALVHELYRADHDGARKVAALFGRSVLAADGSADRAALGRAVLGDAPALERLNSAVHPLVRERVSTWLADLRRLSDPPRVAVVEATLLVETGSYRDYDLLAVVWCRPEQQLARALARGVGRERARDLIAAQAPLESKRRRADVVIDNSGPLESLEAEVGRAWVEILHRCESLRRP